MCPVRRRTPKRAKSVVKSRRTPRTKTIFADSVWTGPLFSRFPQPETFISPGKSPDEFWADLAEGVWEYFRRYGDFALQDNSLRNALWNLRNREANAPRGPATVLARKDLARALDGYHPPSNRKGPQPRVDAAIIAIEHIHAMAFLGNISNRRNVDVLTNAIARKYSIPAEKAREIVRILQNRRSQVSNAALGVLACKYGVTSGTARQLVTAGRKRCEFSIGLLHHLLGSLLECVRPPVKSHGTVIGENDAATQDLRRSLAPMFNTLRAHMRGLKSRHRVKYFVSHKEEILRLLRTYPIIRDIFESHPASNPIKY